MSRSHTVTAARTTSTRSALLPLCFAIMASHAYVPNENPFASSQDLTFDEHEGNPFEDPPKHPAFDQATADRAVELERREAQLRVQEDNLRREQEQVANIRRNGRNNWPPFYPLIFHSIKDEIPMDSQLLIDRLYKLWLILLVTLIVNMVACIFILISGSSNGGRDLGSSIGYIPVIGILSFLLWYRPIYNGYMKVGIFLDVAMCHTHHILHPKKEQALYYYFYFFFGGWHLVFSIYMIIGIPGTGSAGFIQMIQSYTGSHIAAGILGTVATVGWIIQGFGNAFYYHQIWKHHNAQGHTINGAKTEFATHWAKRSITGRKATGVAAARA
ncbi:hypothetical protein EW145_g490 [Phellinidium pouzarii]|uniref:Secretory carrier-associated membrane protein n=1 Tax=Phellinidium pouzarii TaxID=167371 RepID=A0A4S4LI80_9AGAM|nr:hypothetical protein EW145_g490 [Phellinidium pouzarii]